MLLTGTNRLLKKDVIYKPRPESVPKTGRLRSVSLHVEICIKFLVLQQALSIDLEITSSMEASLKK